MRVLNYLYLWNNMTDMKRFLILGLFVIFTFSGCDTPSTSLPKTDSSVYFITDNSFSFPQGTTDLQIYNCFSDYKFEGEYEATGTYTITETAVLNDKEYSDTLVKNIIKCNIYSVEQLPNKDKAHTFSYHVVFYFDDSSTLDCYYQWQYDSNNSWHNESLKGKIDITLSR